MPGTLRRSNGFQLRPHPLRRRNLRVPCHVTARVEATSETVRGLCTDLSLGGLLFVGPPLDSGERVEVVLELLPYAFVRLSGEVLDRRSLPAGAATAIRFPQLGPRELVAINRFVAFQLA